MSRLLLLLVLLPACKNGNSDTEDDRSPVEPVEGTWLYDESEVLNNGCGFASETKVQQIHQFELAMNGASGFTVTPADGTPPYDCTLDGWAFSCDPHVMEFAKDFPEVPASATLVYTATAQGVFDSDAEITGSHEATVSCSTGDCDVVAQVMGGFAFPCDLSAAWTGTCITCLMDTASD